MKKQAYHIIFNLDYYNKELGFRSRNHMSWNLTPKTEFNFQFGGKLSNSLNRLISIDSEFDANGYQLKETNFGINFEDFFNAQIQGNIYITNIKGVVI